MTDYRTRMFDGQIGFGSGSKVNADDIPTTSTRFWLTNAAQEISGSKIFGDDLDISFNNIIHLGAPINDRDAATKLYVDTVSGSIGQDLNHQVLELYKYVDGEALNVLTAKFDITTQTEIVAASGDSVINVVGISMHNNDTTGANDTQVQLTDGSGSAYLYGGADGSIYLPGRGGVFVLPPSAEFPYFSGSAGNGIYLEPVAGKRVAGNIWYTRD